MLRVLITTGRRGRNKEEIGESKLTAFQELYVPIVFFLTGGIQNLFSLRGCGLLSKSVS